MKLIKLTDTYERDVFVNIDLVREFFQVTTEFKNQKVTRLVFHTEHHSDVKETPNYIFQQSFK